MKYVVLGAGMMGSAVAYDLAKFEQNSEILLCDIDLKAAESVAQTLGPSVRPVRLDVNNLRELGDVMKGATVAVSCVSYSVNVPATEAAIHHGVHMCDLGGNNGVVDRQLGYDTEARTRGITIVPNCGLAPGLINILAMTGFAAFDSVHTIRLRVGGLPQHPRPPLLYQIVFSAEGLLNEYVEPAEMIRDGRRTVIPSMSDLESISFPPAFPHLEAFSTSGGLSILPQLLEGKLHHLDYKTIRYPGHCEKFRTLIDLGFASSEPITVGTTIRTQREVFTELLRRKLQYGDTDLVLARASITGLQGGIRRTLEYEFIDYYDATTQMTAMMRTTSFPTAIIASMLAHDVINTRGVMTPEICVPGERMIAELRRRNITIVQRITDAGDR